MTPLLKSTVHRRPQQLWLVLMFAVYFLFSFCIHFLVSTVEKSLHVSSAHMRALVKAFVEALQKQIH